MSLFENFRSAPQSRQILLWVGGGSILLVALVALYLLFIRQPYEILFNNLRPMDAATIVAELDKKKTPYRLEDRGATILVPADQVDTTRLSVMSADLPLKGMVGFELFNKSDMGLTEFAQRINYQRALQGELARTIMTLEAVDTARVHLSIPEPTVFREDRRPPKASVTIQARRGKSLSADAVRGIQRLVSAAIPDLEMGNVVVLDQQGVEVGVAAQPAAAHSAMEAAYAARLVAAINRDFPRSQARAEVWAEPVAEPTADRRPYTLKVSVNVTPETTEAERRQIESLVVATADLDITQGDMVVLLGEALVQPSASPPLVVAGPPAVSAPKGPSVGFQVWVSCAIGLILLLGAIVFLVRNRQAQTRPLSETDRDALRSELRSLLDRRRSDAAFVP
jgi:flagellar M-ring protein FliF